MYYVYVDYIYIIYISPLYPPPLPPRTVPTHEAITLKFHGTTPSTHHYSLDFHKVTMKKSHLKNTGVPPVMLVGL